MTFDRFLLLRDDALAGLYQSWETMAPSAWSRAVAGLDRKERAVFLARRAGQTLVETGRSVGVSRQRAAQIEDRARLRIVFLFRSALNRP